MEGISGLVHWEETGRKGGGDYERARKLMTQDANAAAVGALAGGATEVLINDSHGGMRNIIVEQLDERVRLISGSPKYLSMVEGVDGVDLAMFVGYHSRAHSRGTMNHTYTGTVLKLAINGQVYGECGLNAMIAGHYGVPVVMVTGDRDATDEATALLPGVRVVTVKETIGQLAANLLHPKRARALIESAATEALREAVAGRAPAPLEVAKPTKMELHFARSAQADAAAVMPGAERPAGNVITWQGQNGFECYRAFRALIALGGRL